MKHSLTSFVGMLPRYQPYLLPDSAAQLMIDGSPVSGGLEAFRQDSAVERLEKLPKDFYRYTRDSSTKQWLFFDKDVDLARTAVIGDTTNQMFISGFDELRTFDTETVRATDTTITLANSYKAGISAPDTPNLAKVTQGTTTNAITYSYVIAYARKWETSGKLDLGPASLPAVTVGNQTFIDLAAGEQAVVSNIKANPHADENTSWCYIYRSSVTTGGDLQWRYAVSFPMVGGALPQGVTYDSSTSSYTYTDWRLEEDLGETPQNLTWSCPANLRGLISLRNGVFAGFVDNTVYLSAPYQGHAFPPEYAIPLDYKVIGLGSFGNTLVICTEANTFLCVVNDPSATILVPLQEPQACVSKRSIVSMNNVVYFATRYGITAVTASGAKTITAPYLTEKEWQFYKPETIQAASFQNKYLMFFDSKIVPYNGLLMDFNDLPSGVLGLSQKVSAMIEDDSSSSVFITYIHPVYRTPMIFSFNESPSWRRMYQWTSKKFLNNEGLFNLAAGKVNFYDDSYALKTYEYTYLPGSHPFNGPVVNQYSINGDASTNGKRVFDNKNQWCILTLYVDDIIKKVISVTRNRPFRLPAGFRGDSFYVSINSSVPISRVQMASSIGELE
jgi:hypothetical protein